MNETKQKNVEELDREIAELEDRLERVEGTKTEVYTRIVGYYRSVANWNKGKREEYKYRRLFSEPADMLLPGTAGKSRTGEAKEKPAEEILRTRDIAAYTFFYRNACPNCPPVKEYVAGLSIPGNSLDVDTDEGMEKAAQHRVLAAPTVVFFDDRGREVARAHTAEKLDAVLAGGKVRT